MSFRSLEARHYVATDGDIKALAKHNLEAARARQTVRATYLRALVATAQHELKQRKELRAGGSIPDGQLAAVELVDDRFYRIVLETVITPDIADHPRLSGFESHRRAIERNRRSGFARSAKSTLVGWLRIPGHDLRTLEAATVTKNLLANDTPRGGKPLRPALVRRQTKAAAEKFLRLTDKLVEVDEAAAVEILHHAMLKLSKLLERSAGEPTRKPSVAVQEDRPLLTDTGVFMLVRKLRAKRASA
jgi:hypothetical protein